MPCCCTQARARVERRHCACYVSPPQAICVLAIPDGETRRISEFGVFIVTAVTSVFAYVWIVFCLTIWTPDRITIAEAVITFLFFPLLVLVAWAQDNGWWRENANDARAMSMGNIAHTQAAQLEDGKVFELENPNNVVDALKAKHYDRRRLSSVSSAAEGRREEVHEIIRAVEPRPTFSRMVHRVNAIRALTGRRRL